MTTPEGKIKAKVKKVLARYPIYGHWPVPCGYGDSTLDFIGCMNGAFFAIETKVPGSKPTARQNSVIERMRAAGGVVFFIDGDTTELEQWLDAQLVVIAYDQKVAAAAGR